MIILPRANHSLGISETGAIQGKWRGYPPGALKTMTDWVHGVIDDPSQIATMKQEGFAQETGVLSKVDTLRKTAMVWQRNSPGSTLDSLPHQLSCQHDRGCPVRFDPLIPPSAKRGFASI